MNSTEMVKNMNNICTNRALSLVCIVVALSSGTASASLIQNGSFESPQTSDGIYPGLTPDHWIGGAYLFSGNTWPGFWPAPQNGNQYEDFGYTPYLLSQSFNVSAPGQYLLTWYDNAAAGYFHQYSVSVTGNSPVSFSGTGSAATWASRSLFLTLAAGSNTLTFVAGVGSDSLVDNVSLVAVPEPSTYLAGIGALGMLSLFGLRNRE